MSVSPPFRRVGGPLFLSVCVLGALAATSTVLAADATVGTGGACTSADFFTALDTVQGSGGGTIDFDCAAPLTVTFPAWRQISTAVTIDGGSRVTFTNTPGASLFQVFAQGRLTLRNLTVMGLSGNMLQFAIENFGTLRIENALVLLNTMPRSLIGNYGTLQVAGVQFTGNALPGGTPNSRGAVLYNDGGNAAFDGARFLDNGGTDIDTGGVMFVNAGAVTVRDADFIDNRAFDGGAVFVNTGAEFVAVDSEFSGNSASWGGALEIQGGSARLVRVRMTENTSVSDGGAVWLLNGGSLEVQGSRFDGNSAGQHGGAISNLDSGHVDIAWSAFDGNTAGQHGGAIHSAGTLGLRASTLVDNEAGTARGGGGVYQTGTGVAATLEFVTIVGNRAGYGAGITNESGSGAGSSITIGRSIVADNRIDSTEVNNCAGDSVSSIGHNLSDGTTCGGAFTAPTDELNATLPFEAFGAHGGPTPTLPPTAASDAIGFVTSGCDLLDQRGAPRTPAPCDAGAYERGATPGPFDRLFGDGFESP